MSTFDLRKLADPFPASDIEWRVSRSGMNKSSKPFAFVLAYITARAIANRLDDVCGPANWMNTQQQIKELRPGTFTVQVGISIRVGDDWVVKYDVSEPTTIEPAKGGFSGAMKRAGAQWGIGRYLYLLDETYAECSEDGNGKGWNYARLSDKQGGGSFYWKPPQLPSWALPNDLETDKPVTESDINSLKRKWAEKFAPKEKGRQALATGFTQFVCEIVGEIPVEAPACWTSNMLKEVHSRIANTRDPKGPPSNVPFT